MGTATALGKSDAIAGKIPLQRSCDDFCHRCGAQDIELEPDDEVIGQQRCVESWRGCYDKWRPRCPQWCSDRHDSKHERPFVEGVWFHSSIMVSVVVGTEARTHDVIEIGVNTFEKVGGGMEPTTVFIGDRNLTPDQARAYASALLTVADLADMTPADLKHGQAHQEPDAVADRVATAEDHPSAHPVRPTELPARP